MKKNIRFLSVLTVMVFVFVLATDALAQTILGGYKEIEKTDPEAVTAADFAVKAQSEKTELEFQRGEIAKAERQSVAGANYRICMQVIANEDEPYFVQAVVYLDLKGNRSLTSWADSDCGGAAGLATTGSTALRERAADNFKSIDKTDAGARLAADFAIKEQTKKTNTKITPATIVKAEDQEPKLGARNFRLCLKMTVDGKPSTAQAVVSTDQYSNHKLVRWIEAKCDPGEDDFVQVANTDAGIGLAADFAVKERSKATKIQHTLAGVLKAEEKGLFSMTYRVCMQVAEEGKTNIIQAVVTMDQYSNMKLVSWKHSKCRN